LPQERYNAVWVREKDAGLVVKNFDKILNAAEQMLDPETFKRFRCNAKQMQNRALFEIPDILSRILRESNN
jgi:UDP-N-acetylglucosamine:LPS N-acetylglucosamine transferase